MLRDLIELREHNWVPRRDEEKAKTIAQIHEQVAREEVCIATISSDTLILAQYFVKLLAVCSSTSSVSSVKTSTVVQTAMLT
jgi:hypothetical protein